LVTTRLTSVTRRSRAAERSTTGHFRGRDRPGAAWSLRGRDPFGPDPMPRHFERGGLSSRRSELYKRLTPSRLASSYVLRQAVVRPGKPRPNLCLYRQRPGRNTFGDDQGARALQRTGARPRQSGAAQIARGGFAAWAAAKTSSSRARWKTRSGWGLLHSHRPPREGVWRRSMRPAKTDAFGAAEAGDGWWPASAPGGRRDAAPSRRALIHQTAGSRDSIPQRAGGRGGALAIQRPERRAA